MPDIAESIDHIDARISIVREDLRQLVEQAAAFSGAGDDELIEQRIGEQEAELESLTTKRAELAAGRMGKKPRTAGVSGFSDADRVGVHACV